MQRLVKSLWCCGSAVRQAVEELKKVKSAAGHCCCFSVDQLVLVLRGSASTQASS